MGVGRERGHAKNDMEITIYAKLGLQMQHI